MKPIWLIRLDQGQGLIRVSGSRGGDLTARSPLILAQVGIVWAFVSVGLMRPCEIPVSAVLLVGRDADVSRVRGSVW